MAKTVEQKTVEQIVNERIQQQIGALVIETTRLGAELEAAREELAALKAAAPAEPSGRAH